MQQRNQKVVWVKKTLKGTQSFHRIKPVSPYLIRAYKTSDSVEYFEFRLSGQDEPDFNKSIAIGDYVACNYLGKFWIGIVLDYNEEFEDFDISFLNCRKENRYFFPEKIDRCWLPLDDIICHLDAPNITPGIKIIYTFNAKKLAKALKKI